MKGKKKMNITELRDTITDLTGKIWREKHLGHTIWRMDWIHPDGADGPHEDGTYLVWEENTDSIDVFTEDGVPVYHCQIPTMNEKLNIAVGYAQMAGGLHKQFPDMDNVPCFEGCNMVVEALYLAGDYDPAFCSGNDGVSWWTENGDFVAEYNNDQKAYIVWWQGLYWVSATPAGYIKSLEKARSDKEKIEFAKIKRELSDG